jgi:hypothetical protein
MVGRFQAAREISLGEKIVRVLRHTFVMMQNVGGVLGHYEGMRGHLKARHCARAGESA